VRDPKLSPAAASRIVRSRRFHFRQPVTFSYPTIETRFDYYVPADPRGLGRCSGRPNHDPRGEISERG